MGALLLPFMMIGFFACLASYALGRATTKYPSDAEMIERLVDGKVEERLRTVAEIEVNQDIRQRADQKYQAVRAS